MDLPAHFAQHDSAALHALMAAHPLATLGTPSPDGITADLVPLQRHATAEGGTELRGHVARASVAPQRVDDAAWLRALMGGLTDSHEAPRDMPRSVDDAPADDVQQSLRAIVGIRVVVDSLVGKWKVSPNRDAADRAGVAAGLAAERARPAPTGGWTMADLVRTIGAPKGHDTMKNTLPRTLAAATLLLAAATTHASPGIAPGLWEHRMTMQSSDPRLAQQMAEAQRAMAAMPPEQRRMMEQMMAQHGVGLAGIGGGGMTMQICITPEQAAKQELPPPGDRCTHRITGRTANSLKFAVECPAEQARGEGETVFSGNKAYDGRFNMQRSKAGATETMQMQVQARWLGADCGAVRPAK